MGSRQQGIRDGGIARLALPGVIAGSLAWLMVGCLYIPTFESRDLNGAKQDFRPLVGEGRAIARGRVTRPQVEALLGAPPYASANGRAIAYVIRARQGIWVSPLCLDARAATTRQFGVKLVFDEHGLLARYEVAATETHHEPASFGLGPTMDEVLGSVQTDLILDFNGHEGIVRGPDAPPSEGPEYLRPSGPK
jgi:hypothetical protein